jgi:hypothetical protein
MTGSDCLRLRLRLRAGIRALPCRRANRRRRRQPGVVTLRHCLTVSSHRRLCALTCRRARGVRQRDNKTVTPGYRSARRLIDTFCNRACVHVHRANGRLPCRRARGGHVHKIACTHTALARGAAARRRRGTRVIFGSLDARTPKGCADLRRCWREKHAFGNSL